MLTLHHLQNSRSQRILWLLEELGVTYQVIEYKRNPITQLAPDDLKAVHPLGKAPILTDGPLSIAESGAIVDYLIDTYAQGKWQPVRHTQDWLRYRFAMHFAEGSLMPQLVITLLLTTAKQKTPFLVRPVIKAVESGILKQYVKPTLNAQLAYLEQELEQAAWFAGSEPTGADVMLSFPLEAARARGLLKRYPNLRAWVNQVHARPAYKRALAKTSTYDYA